MKTFLTIIALCVACSSFAQIEKGRSYLTGQVSGQSRKTDYHGNQNVTGPVKQSSYGVTLGYGYLFADNWAVALSVGGNGNTVRYNNDNTSSGSGFSVSPYVRKFFPIGEKFYFHVDGGLSYANLRSKYKVAGSPPVPDYTTKVNSVYVSPGITYFVSDRFALTADLGGLSYNGSTDKGSSGEKTTHKGFDASFGLSSFAFGASIYF